MSCSWSPARRRSNSLKALKKSDAKAFDVVWKSVREDGAYVEAGENDNVIVQKLEANPNAFGVFGYSFLEENVAKLQGAEIDGVVPSFETIADGSYKPSRELFVYIKKAHVGVIPGLDKFAEEYVSDKPRPAKTATSPTRASSRSPRKCTRRFRKPSRRWRP